LQRITNDILHEDAGTGTDECDFWLSGHGDTPFILGFGTQENKYNQFQGQTFPSCVALTGGFVLCQAG
jgi:hypothetical protein